MTQRKMFEAAMSRPANYYKLSPQRQWEIDDTYGVLDWDGKMTDEEREQFRQRFGV